MNTSSTVPQSAALARLFSSSVVHELARRGHSPLLGRVLHESGLACSLDRSLTLRDLFDWAFRVLRAEGNRHECIYKNAVATNILLGKHSLNTSCMLTEFRAGCCKVDVVVLNGTSMAYEVKSERDNLDRLENQLCQYMGVFDQVQVIASGNHVATLERTIPEEVGILVLTGRFQISVHRPATSNVARVRPELVFQSLQRREYLAILRDCGIAVPQVPNTRIHAIARQLFASLTPEQAHGGMVAVLKKTRSPIALREFIRSVPYSLKAAAVSVPLGAGERSRLLEVLDKRLDSVFG